ncbi:hypothetical protein [Streptosporangium sp. CA-115845]|uniref:hypothetical protein n=1 Tax=Streptosporangium sp. CA-115845 TaxID=3240071 RepID=UPI003D8D1BE1
MTDPHIRTPQWVLRLDSGRGDTELAFPAQGDALSALAAEARADWSRVTGLRDSQAPAEPPADDAEAIAVYFTATRETYSLTEEHDPAILAGIEAAILPREGIA